MHCRDCEELMLPLSVVDAVAMGFCRNCGRLVIMDGKSGKAFEYQLTEESPVELEMMRPPPLEEESSEVRDTQTIEPRDTAELYGVGGP